MTKSTKSTKRVRKIKTANTSAAQSASVLAIEFHASVPDDAINAVEILEIDASDETNESDVFAKYVHALALSLRERVDYELSKSAQSCADKYVNYAKDILNERVAKVFYDARVVPDFCNRSERAGYRFNEKTTMRMRDLARFIAKADALTNFTRAIFTSAYKYHCAALDFTASHAFACCSANDMRHDVVRVDKVYGETTQQAQHSMSLNALVEMHALTEIRSGRTSRFVVNHDSYVAQALIAALAL